jgi:polyphenol oxidase
MSSAMAPPVLSSPLLPVPHAFTTREGGISEGPFASLNLGFSVGDDRAKVEENLKRTAASVGLEPQALLTVSQVHSDAVLKLDSTPDSPFLPCGEADALWTQTPGLAVGVKTADCVPILLVDPKKKRVAAVHSGWRGTDLKIAARAVEALCREGSSAKDLVAAIGPSIRGCCYAVSADLAQRFRAQFGDGAAELRGEQWYLDLAPIVRTTLTEAGLPQERIDLIQPCTSCDRRFFSHRRDQGKTGRQLSFAVCSF